MAKTEQNACLSTSTSSSVSLGLSTEKALPRAPPPPPPPLKDVEEKKRRPEERGRPREEQYVHEAVEEEPPQEKPAVPPKTSSPRRSGSDYVLALCYVLVYLELAWLIFSLLRMYV